MSRTETVEEYFARGGKVTKLPAQEPKEKTVIKSTVVKPAVLYTATSSAIDTSSLSKEEMEELLKQAKDLPEHVRENLLEVASADLGYRAPDYFTAANELGERKVRKKKIKVPDVSGIEMDLIPDSLRKSLGL